MVDNVTAPAEDKVFATDEIGGVHHPRSKVGFGVENSYADVTAQNPLPVVDSGALTAIQALVPYIDGVEALLTAVGTMIGQAQYYQPTQPVSAVALPLPAGAATQTTLAAILALGTEVYNLAANITLAAGAAGPTVTVPRGAYFFFDASFSGSSPSVKLQRLGSDGTTWLDVVTRTASNATGDPIAIPNGAQLRLYNAGAGALTAVSGVLA